MQSEKYQTGSKRLFAALIDGVVFLPLFYIELFSAGSSNILCQYSCTIFISTLSLAYPIILHYRTGQTIGKWAMQIKVVDISELRNLSFRQSIYRESVYLLINLGSGIYFGIKLITSTNKQAILEEFKNFGDMIILGWIILELISMLMNDKRRAIHDFLAGSVVIRK